MDHAREVMYQAFGLRSGCGADAVHRRYRELGFRVYPDLHPDDSRSVQKFRAIRAAYEELSRREQSPFTAPIEDAEWESPVDATAPPRPEVQPTSARTSTDQPAAEVPSTPPTPLEDASGTEPPPLTVPVEITFEQAFGGVTLPFKTLVGTLNVQVPRGVEHDHRFTLQVPDSSGQPVTVHVVIRVADHPRYRREGSALYVRAAVSPGRALIGGNLLIQLPDEVVRVPVPEGSRRGQMIPVPGKGMRAPEGRGYLFVELSDSWRALVKRPPR